MRSRFLRKSGICCSAALAGVLLASACKKSETTSSEPAQAAAATPAPVDMHLPFGFIDTPKENGVVAGGSWAYGWALDDSGIASVEASLDNAPGTPAAIGQPFPGVKEAYPNFPNSEKAGFGFSMPKLAAGPHLLVVTVTARDGGKTELKRHIQIK